MQITRQTEYAVRILLELAEAAPGQLVQSRTIADRHGLPEKFINKTVQLLVKAGYVEARRGMKGGIRLALPAETITAADVLVAIEGKVALNPCLANSAYCKMGGVCSFRRVLQRTQEAMLRELSQATIAGMAGGQNTEICNPQEESGSA